MQTRSIFYRIDKINKITSNIKNSTLATATVLFTKDSSRNG